jgi:hypothetical protein
MHQGCDLKQIQIRFLAWGNIFREFKKMSWTNGPVVRYFFMYFFYTPALHYICEFHNY